MHIIYKLWWNVFSRPGISAKNAKKDFLHMGDMDGSRIAEYGKGKPTPHEDEIVNSYNSLLMKNFKTIRRWISFALGFIAIFLALFLLQAGFSDLLQAKVGAGWWFNVLNVLPYVVVLLPYFIVKMPKRSSTVTEERYKTAQTWLKLVREESRKSMPAGCLLFVFGSLLLEATAIGILVAAYVGNFTQQIEWIAGGAMGLIVAVILAGLVHWAGVSLYKERKRKALDDALNHEDKKSIQAMDEDALANKPWFVKWILPVAAAAVVLVVVFVAFQQRANFNFELIARYAAEEERYRDEVLRNSDDSNLPAGVLNQQKSVQSEVAQEADAYAKSGVINALLLLSIIFVLINLAGGAIGYKYSMLEKSGESHDDVRDYEEMRDNKERLKQEANTYFSKYYKCLLGTMRNAAQTRGDLDAENIKHLMSALRNRGAYKMKDDSVGNIEDGLSPKPAHVPTSSTNPSNPST